MLLGKKLSRKLLPLSSNLWGSLAQESELSMEDMENQARAGVCLRFSQAQQRASGKSVKNG